MIVGPALAQRPEVNSRASHGRGGHSAAHEGAERLLEGRVPQRAPPAATVASVSGTFQLYFASGSWLIKKSKRLKGQELGSHREGAVQ